MNFKTHNLRKTYAKIKSCLRCFRHSQLHSLDIIKNTNILQIPAACQALVWVLGIQTLISYRLTPKEPTVPSLRTYFVCSLEDVRETGLENKVFRREGLRNTVGKVSLRANIYLSLAPEPLK